MRRAACIIGLLWMVGVAFAGVVLLGSGKFQGSRAYMSLLFCAALPGLLIFRWGKGSELQRKTMARRTLRPKAPIDLAAEAGHVMQLEIDSIETRANLEAKSACLITQEELHRLPREDENLES